MQDAWRAYLELALGVTEASKKKAQKVAQRLVGKGGATAAQLQALTDDLLSAGTANREALTKMVRGEVERTMSRVGLASADEVAALNARVRELEEELRAARAAGGGAGAGPASDDALETLSAGAGLAPQDTAATPSSVNPDAVNASSVDAATPGGTAAKKTVAKKAVAKKTVAKKAVAKKTVAKRAPAEVAPAADAAGPAAPARKTAKKAAKKTARKATGNKAAGKATPPAAGEA